jgi:membrane-associated phospholipid phosphatase
VRQGVVTTACLCCLLAPTVSMAQTAAAPAPPSLAAPHAATFWAPFKEFPKDVAGLFTEQNARIVAPAALMALFANRWDQNGVVMARTRFKSAAPFKAGNIGGGLYAQTGGAFAVYALGRITKSTKVTEVGGDLVRAQLLTQASVQTMKFIARRSRPDGSDRLSLPSGHSAGTFATATILNRHFGWKAGLPAYAAGVYVATSRMSAAKHHMSDVIMGAAFGMVAGRTVTIRSGGAQFDVGLSPTPGGGAVTFTRK